MSPRFFKISNNHVNNIKYCAFFIYFQLQKHRMTMSREVRRTAAKSIKSSRRVQGTKPWQILFLRWNKHRQKRKTTCRQSNRWCPSEKNFVYCTSTGFYMNEVTISGMKCQEEPLLSCYRQHFRWTKAMIVHRMTRKLMQQFM